jgi:flagellin-specific chaperone FliS
MLNPNYAKASAHYRTLALSAQIENVEPHVRVALLYQELLLCINILTVQASKCDTLLLDPQAHRARSIIVALRAGLNFESGELAETLAGLYAALASELEDRLANPDPLRFAELRAGVESIAAAWNAIADR